MTTIRQVSNDLGLSAMLSAIMKKKEWLLSRAMNVGFVILMSKA